MRCVLSPAPSTEHSARIIRVWEEATGLARGEVEQDRQHEFPPLIAEGKLPNAIANRLAAELNHLDGKRVVITVKEQKRRRSMNQNSYYWGVVVAAVTEMFRDAGNYVDADNLHDFLKLRVGELGPNIVTPDGKMTKSLGSTAKLSTMKFEWYLERIRAWAAEFGLVIPLPNESTT
jgi:hypothetical protein